MGKIHRFLSGYVNKQHCNAYPHKIQIVQFTDFSLNVLFCKQYFYEHCLKQKLLTIFLWVNTFFSQIHSHFFHVFFVPTTGYRIQYMSRHLNYIIKMVAQFGQHTSVKFTFTIIILSGGLFAMYE